MMTSRSLGDFRDRIHESKLTVDSCVFKVTLTAKNVFHLVESSYGIRKNGAKIPAFGRKHSMRFQFQIFPALSQWTGTNLKVKNINCPGSI